MYYCPQYVLPGIVQGFHSAICPNFISQRATKARIIANCLVAVILTIALQISLIIESLEVPKNLYLRITLFVETPCINIYIQVLCSILPPSYLVLYHLGNLTWDLILCLKHLNWTTHGPGLRSAGLLLSIIIFINLKQFIWSGNRQLGMRCPVCP